VSSLAVADAVSRVDLDIQGVHCSACIWLIEKLFVRRVGHGSIVLDPAIGRIHIVIGSNFDLVGFVKEVEQFGYLLGPARKSEHRASSDLVWRMGICIAIAMNSMIFAIAMYAGLADGPLFALFQRLNIGLSTVSLVVGGSVFFRSAWLGVRRGVLHLDLPIAVGIALAYGGSLCSTAAGRGVASYVDTLNVFIALMLVGRWLRERVLEKNRLEVLASDGADGLLTRKRVGSSLATVPCTSIRAGDILTLSPGDLVPVDARLLGAEGATCSLDWINGESALRFFPPESVVPAGSFLGGTHVVEVLATTDFETSSLVELLRTPIHRDADAAMETPWWHRVTRIYVALALAVAAIGGLAWLVATRDPVRAIGVTTAVLVVTCPCAFGLATPLAYDLAHARLRRKGLYVRSPGFLDRAGAVRTVVFDKTGTLTSGASELENPDALASLSRESRDVLLHLVERSHHPKARAVHSAIARTSNAGETSAMVDVVTEWPSLGLEVVHEGRSFRLGSPAWAARGVEQPSGDLVFAVDGAPLATLSTREKLRADAAAEVAALEAEGFQVWLLSGDEPSRVARAAEQCGLPGDRAVGGLAARAKADWLQVHDQQDVLMVGDGVNDTLAVERAFCSGTPAIDRPFMASRSDFYFVTPGLAPIREALHAARAVCRVRSMNLAIAVSYNVTAVTLAFAGLMSPLLCAVLMPLSSLTTLGATRVALSPGSSLWKSSACKSS
jgi:Cu2+-exporting ATPase